MLAIDPPVKILNEALASKGPSTHTLSRPITGTEANTKHTRHQLPFGTALEQVSESLNRPEPRGHTTSFAREINGFGLPDRF